MGRLVIERRLANQVSRSGRKSPAVDFLVDV